MKKTVFVVLLLGLSSMSVFAEREFDLNFGVWNFDRESTRLGLDISVGAGYSVPLNLNKKPADFDIAENYDPVVPTIIARAGLGAYSYGDVPEINGQIALEYIRTAYESNDANLVFNAFGISNSFSVHPAEHISIRQGGGSGLYILSMDPDNSVTGSFADYTSDIEARTGKPHLYSGKELGFGFYLGDTPFMEISADVRVDTYYPRYIFWPEFARGMVYSAIESGFNGAAKGTDVWALGLIGPVVTTALEVFNLNFYPDKVGEKHQHVVTPSLTITIHF